MMPNSLVICAKRQQSHLRSRKAGIEEFLTTNHTKNTNGKTAVSVFRAGADILISYFAPELSSLIT